MIRNLPARLLFAAGFLGGSQLPKYLDGYRQYLAGRLQQARADLGLFQAIADRFHGGDLEALIRRHLESSDPAFRAEGEAIRTLADQVARLTEAMNGLQGNLPDQIVTLLRNGEPDAMAASWTLFQPGLVFTPEALLCAVVAGVVLALPALGLGRLFRRRSRRAAPT
ncbi:MAG TPA: DUF2937 family protein [Sedimenticola thiotaurini]|uniref:DUF2937 family protein n=1 Tax=Sedimenticola thiotaurini TaxID=1543721 RepID=A0A831W8M4_9GAMM|nr:DUF2937 family protein [Sedimenticola thiotaurini]